MTSQTRFSDVGKTFAARLAAAAFTVCGSGRAAASPARNSSSSWVRWLALTAFKVLASPVALCRAARSLGRARLSALRFCSSAATRAFGELELGGQLAALGLHRVALVRGLLHQLLRQPLVARLYRGDRLGVGTFLGRLALVGSGQRRFKPVQPPTQRADRSRSVARDAASSHAPRTDPRRPPAERFRHVVSVRKLPRSRAVVASL